MEVGLGDAMRAWARTLPERHGGRAVLWALVAMLARGETIVPEKKR